MENRKCIYEDDSLNEIENEIFYVTDYYKKPSHIKEYVSLLGNNVGTFSFPKEDNRYKCGAIPNYKNTSLLLGSIIIANSEYWFKVMYDNNWVYIKASDTKDGNKYTKYHDDKKALLSEFSFSYDVNCFSTAVELHKEPFNVEKYTNKTMQNKRFTFTARDLYILEYSCNHVINRYYIDNNKLRYSTGDKYPDWMSKKIRNYVYSFLRPELILAISSSESGFFYGNTKSDHAGGVGMTFEGIKAAYNSIGNDNLLNCYKEWAQLEDEEAYNSIEKDKYYGFKTASVTIAHSIRKVIEEKDSDDLGQILYDSFYTYGAGFVPIEDYYGYKKRGEAGPSAAVKCFSYAILTNKTAINSCLNLNDIVNQNGEVDLIKISKLLSNYTYCPNKYTEGNNYSFEIIIY